MIRNKTIFCYLDDPFHGRLCLGNLYVQNERERETCSFYFRFVVIIRQDTHT